MGESGANLYISLYLQPKSPLIHLITRLASSLLLDGKTILPFTFLAKKKKKKQGGNSNEL